jgi:type IV secretion system protein VirD4
MSESQLGLIGAGCAAALLAWLWLAGALAALLFGSGWTSVPVSELLMVAVRLPSHLDAPGAAWPSSVRRSLPGASGIYVGLVLSGCILGGVGIAAQLVAGRLEIGRDQKDKHPPRARWARRRDLIALRVRRAVPGRVTLGRSLVGLLAAEERQSVIVVAPTQSGKTTGLAIPALLEWQGPVVATSIKTDLLRDSLARRMELGEVMIFDPAQATGMVSTRISPLASCGSWRGAMRMAHWLAAAARAGSGGLRESEFWYATAEKLMAPMLFAAASAGETMDSVLGWLDAGPEASDVEVAELLTAAGSVEAQRAWGASQSREERQRSSVFTTAEMILAAFADPRVIEETAGADYSPARLLDGRANTLYLCAPAHEQERLRTLFATIVSELLAVAYESSAASGRPLDPPLLLVLDEAANIAPIPNLDELAATGAGQGVQLLSVFQDLAQVRSRYGDRAQTIVNNHRAKLFGTGISDPETLRYVSQVIGPGEFEQRSRSDGRRGGTTSTKTYRDLIGPMTVRGGDPGNALLIYGHLPPTEVRLRPWYAEKSLRALGSGKAGGRGGV